jgi:hypothetical protein
MEIREFTEKVRPNGKLIIEGEEFEVLQVVKFRLDDGSSYFKCFLSKDRVIAEDSEMNVYIFVGPVQTEFTEPMPKKLDFDGKRFDFLYDAHAIAEEIWGDAEFKKGEQERFWDYEAEDGSYLSLGINEVDGQKADFYGKKVSVNSVNLK